MSVIKLIIYILISIFIIFFLSLIYPYYKYSKLRSFSRNYFDNYSKNSSNNDIGFLDGSIGSRFIETSSNILINMINNRSNPIYLLYDNKGSYINLLENHFIGKDMFLIDNILFVPNSFSEYLLFVNYLFNESDKIKICNIKDPEIYPEIMSINNQMWKILYHDGIFSNIYDVIELDNRLINEPFIFTKHISNKCEHGSKIIYINKMAEELDSVTLFTILCLQQVIDEMNNINFISIDSLVDKVKVKMNYVIKTLLKSYNNITFYTFFIEDIDKIINNICKKYTFEQPINLTDEITNNWMYIGDCRSVWRALKYI